MRDFHEAWGFGAIFANAVAGSFMLVAWKVVVVRKAAWWIVGAAQIAMLVQVATGVMLVTIDEIEPPGIHMFYGFVAFLTVGLLYSYRYVWRARGWMELAYGLGGLFLMGLGFRAVFQVAS
jgi:hypothetical protein